MGDMWDSIQPYSGLFLCLSASPNSQEQMSSNSHLWIIPVIHNQIEIGAKASIYSNKSERGRKYISV